MVQSVHLPAAWAQLTAAWARSDLLASELLQSIQIGFLGMRYKSFWMHAAIAESVFL